MIPSSAMRYKYVKRKYHPLSPPCGVLPEHRVVLYDAIGPGPHPCHWCQKPVDWSDQKTSEGCLVVDHLDNDGLNNALDNLVPSCHHCNFVRTHDLRFKDELFLVIDGKRHAAEERTCLTCGKTFLKRTAVLKTRPNAGRYCSKACMYNRGVPNKPRAK